MFWIFFTAVLILMVLHRSFRSAVLWTVGSVVLFIVLMNIISPSGFFH